MKKRLFLFALALILLSNAVVLARVAFNRAAVLESLVFTEREMPNSYSPVRENSGVIFELKWRTAVRPDSQHDYNYGYNRTIVVTDELRKLLGFNTLNCEEARYRYNYNYNDNETAAWVLMELNGQAYSNEMQLLESRWHEATLANEDKNKIISIERQLQRLREEDTRLYAIAVAAEPNILLSAITDRDKQFIVKAVVADSRNCNNEIFIKQISLQRLFVPKSALTDKTNLPQKYHVHVAIGNLGEAWIEKVNAR